MENYCEAIRLDLNRREEIRFDETLPHAVAKKRIIDLEFNLSTRFTFMAQMFERFPEVERECALTAFSLNPTQKSFNYVRSCAKQFWGHLVNDENSSSSMQPAHSYCTRRQRVLSTHKRTVFVPKGTVENDCYDPHAIPSYIYNDPTLQKFITEELAQDMMIVIHSPRIKTLTWSVIDWAALEDKCLSLLNDGELKRCNIEMNLSDATKQLKYFDYQAKQMQRLSYLNAVEQLRKTKEKAEAKRKVAHINRHGDLLGFGPPLPVKKPVAIT